MKLTREQVEARMSKAWEQPAYVLPYRIAQNRTQCVDRHRSSLVKWHGDPFFIGRSAHMQLAAPLAVLLKRCTSQRPDPLPTVHSWKLGAHAAAGTDRRVMNSDSPSTGIGSPSSGMPSTCNFMASAMLA